ncbi:HlyD family secretion protein [Polymorphobacter megasporae]|uniref:HlyD family secretion protein n=1 Tax=Glacieibacterium megasporae TaxID=2835787 RepID=UPI001C1E7B00|nr:HlyD family secretion protein [Polymorphobacter megasporae]UAJ10575.1 HlyD family secretion protein [Polymorphobacter megasporae]
MAGLIGGTSGVLLLLYVWQLWPFTTPIVTTIDSYVQGRVTVMEAQDSGYIAQVVIDDYQFVVRGQPLFRIDDRTYRQKLEQVRGTLDAVIAQFDNSTQTIAIDRAQLFSARADLVATLAEEERTAIDLRRILELVSHGSLSVRQGGQARSDAHLASANVLKSKAAIQVAQETISAAIVTRAGLAAQVESNRASLAQAKIDLSNTVLYAPRDGQIGEASVRPGQYVTAGTQLIYLVPNEIWVIANYKETQTHHIRIGQPATVSVDALAHARLTGRVEAISPATGSEFSVLKPDNATGNFTKVVQRLPIRIAVDRDQLLAAQLRPGMSVTTRIDTTGTVDPADRQ